MDSVNLNEKNLVQTNVQTHQTDDENSSKSIRKNGKVYIYQLKQIVEAGQLNSSYASVKFNSDRDSGHLNHGQGDSIILIDDVSASSKLDGFMYRDEDFHCHLLLFFIVLSCSLILVFHALTS